MKRLLCTLALLCAAQTHAEPLSEDVMGAFTQPLMAWLMRAYPELPIRSLLPHTAFVSHKEILRMTRGTELSRTVGACYLGTIYLDDRLDVTRAHDRSVLLHELVHYAQNNCAIPRDMAERVMLEDQAYAIQARWLTEQGYINVVFK